MERSRAESLNSYVTDMIALEEHIAKAIKAQSEVHREKHPEEARMLTSMLGTIEAHAQMLEKFDAMDEDPGAAQQVAEAVKRAGAMLAGMGAAAIDALRHEKLAKNLRDDITAFSLASTGYLMLLTSARALRDEDVAGVAHRHLDDYAKMIVTLNKLIPDAVLHTLRDDELPIDEGVTPGILDAYREAWAQA